MPAVVPELKHQESPEWFTVVTNAGGVFTDPTFDLVSIEQALSFQSRTFEP